MRQQLNNHHKTESPNYRKQRTNMLLLWIGIMMLAAMMGLMTNRWMLGESLLYAAVPPLKLETSDGFYEIGKSEGKLLIMFFSFPG